MGRVKGILIQELKQFLPPLKHGDTAGWMMVHTIAEQRRRRWYARLHNGAVQKRYTAELLQIQADTTLSMLYTALVPSIDVERVPYITWRESCRFTGLRPDWMRVCPEFERALHSEFDQPRYQEQFKRKWKEKVGSAKAYRNAVRVHKHMMHAIGVNTCVQTMWLNNGGHLHRMPPYRFGDMLFHQFSAYVARFLVLLMQIKRFRVLAYDEGYLSTLKELERDYPEQSERARHTCVGYVEPVVSEPPLARFNFKMSEEAWGRLDLD